ncbi:MAG TPA: VOC family protein [Thermomicrobiales bacterium]|jgi:predicted enzyme related to lactoylglutathione lyase
MSTTYHLEHVGIAASSDTFAATVRFYEEVFGWHRIREEPDVLIFVGDGAGGRFEIFVSKAPPLAHPHHLAFAVSWEAFDGLAAQLRAAGTQMDEPFVNTFGDRIVFFTDPAGNRAQIVGRREPLTR